MYIRRRIGGICASRFGSRTIGTSWSRIVALAVTTYQPSISTRLKFCLLSVVCSCTVGKRRRLWTFLLEDLRDRGHPLPVTY